MAEGRLGGLDLLRGIAALSVVCLHIPIAFPQVATPFTKAYLAVDFFFMLSGFVLTRTYHQRFVEGLSANRFLILRLKRLWPTIAIGSIVGMVSLIDVFPPRELALFFAMSLALIPVLTGEGRAVVFPLNGVLWSILFELVANFVHAKALVRMSRLELLFLALTMGFVMVLVAAKLNSFDVGAWKWNFIAGFPRVMLSYVIGCLLYFGWGDRARLALPAWFATALFLAALFAGGLMEGGWLFDLLFVILVCPAVLIGGLEGVRSARRLERVFGDLSFPLYAVHMPVLWLVAKANLPWLTGPPIAIFAAAVTLRLTQQVWRPSLREPKGTLASPEPTAG